MLFQGGKSWADVQVYTLPLFLSELNSQNSLGFDTTSEITAGEIINIIGQTKGITSPHLQAVNISHSHDSLLASVAKTWREKQILPVEEFSKIVPEQDKIIIVASGVADKNGKIIDPWDVLKFNIDFGIQNEFIISTKVVLLDNKDGVLLWQKNYNYAINTGRINGNKGYEFACDEREKFRSYAHNIIARDAVENLLLRLSSKSIDYASKIPQKVNTEEGIGLKHFQNNRMPHVKITPPGETMEQRLLNEDSFEI